MAFEVAIPLAEPLDQDLDVRADIDYQVGPRQLRVEQPVNVVVECELVGRQIQPRENAILAE